MKDIKCPSCGKTFRIDPSSFQEILLQIKDEEFNKQIEERLKLAEEDKNKGIEIAKQELKIKLMGPPPCTVAAEKLVEKSWSKYDPEACIFR